MGADRYWTLAIMCVVASPSARVASADPDSPRNRIAFRSLADRVEISINHRKFATYVFRDADITRPYFAHVHAPNGARVTRNHPPIEGRDATDHATYHPGIWMAFGDLGGADSWRNRDAVVHEAFIDEPNGGAGRGTFAVRNRYTTDRGTRTICHETARFTFLARPHGYLLIWDSLFEPTGQRVGFGDQEEMGLGVRVATPMTVKKGGTIVNSLGNRNEAEVWGRQADWCDYSGTIEARRVGITLMSDPQNFRASWFHARDYGLLVANPFGQKAFTRGPASRVVVASDRPLRLRFSVLIYASPAARPIDHRSAYADFLEQLETIQE